MAEVIEFKGVRFRRYPDSPNWSERAYYTPGIADRQRGVRRLHEEVWIAEHGPIPDGHEIHHGDLNPLNNGAANLVCLTREQHEALHREGWAQQRRTDPDWLAHLDEIRPLAATWHGTEAGLAWHAEHGRRTWAALPMSSRACENCGTPFEVKQLDPEQARFCSGKCRAAARRASGVDDEDRTCELCGEPFRVNRHKATRLCGRRCAGRWARGSRPAPNPAS